MRILLDTNIIIHRESNRVVNQNIGTLFKWIDALYYIKCIHPLTIDEIKRNSNEQVVKTMLAKLASYNLLKTVAPLSSEVQDITNKFDTNENDINDTHLINEVYCKRVDILITEDKKIHSKADALLISSKVFTITDFLEKIISENPDFVDYKVLSVKREYFGNINIRDPFFDSFRKDYVGFDEWFNKKADEVAYICYHDNMLSAFLYIKTEDKSEVYNNIEPVFSPAKRLKIGTFKVTSNGVKLGERFLKIVFDNARLSKVDEVYVTIFGNTPEQLKLISLLEDFGFKYHGIKTTSSGVEGVYVRDFSKPGSIESPRKKYPWLSPSSQVYTIPIKPEYHTELFPDSILNTETKANFVENQPHRNSIGKAYLSHSKNRNLKAGDILVFYRSGGYYRGVATTIGIVEKVVYDIESLNELKELCKRRTVLTEEELNEYWNRYPNTKPFVIFFLYAFSFKKRLNLKNMIDEGILPNNEVVKTINPLGWEKFIKLIKLSGI